MQGRHCALLLLSVWGYALVSCNDFDPVIQPLDDRSGSTFDFITLSGPEDYVAEPLSLFPISSGGAKDGLKRDEGRVPTSSRPITLGKNRADEYRQDLSANNEEQSTGNQLLSLFPLAPGGAKAERERGCNPLAGEGHLTNGLGPIILAEKHEDNNFQVLLDDNDQQSTHNEPMRGKDSQKKVCDNLAEEGHVPNRRGPINTGKQHAEDLFTNNQQHGTSEVAAIVTGGGTNSRKRDRNILSQENHALNRPRPIELHDNVWSYPQHFLSNNRRNPYANREFPISTRMNSQNHEGPGSVSRKAPAPRDLLAETSFRDSEKTTFDPRLGSPSEQAKFWNKLSKRSLEWTPPTISEGAKLAAHFMAIHFQRALSNIPGSFVLEYLHQSNQILIPFAYRLLMKPLKTENWARILLVWRNLWIEETDSIATRIRRQSLGEVLKKFLWISNFICESTLPELFRTNLVSVINGNRQTDMDYLRKLLVQECYEGNQNLVEAASWESKPSVWSLVLTELKTQAFPITPKPEDIAKVVQDLEPTYLFGEATWGHIVGTSDQLLPISRPCCHLIKLPGGLKTELKNLFECTGFDHLADLQSDFGSFNT
ncbi:hypothetical protein PTTG_25405 [Puccinia triticina 1-1 BBBD Race 1]|uniref:HECT domain-containing protein n=2 Tax=Puccinia triticina TaxID=208348 RepID=A0A180H553_PUCT1|nr:uncharacterized protein PtA15_13A473 [Puccinia triticina]OAV99533.1 hypothetical protein PTTG_25405 [Puccinia triticina 1-1 BBBD Race 1]WAQ91072.1 hypothetical protein PtA15_13A473 [Puccinia triticina]WAR61262.1 hypothetical protein PtB15_13B516 [Puccinia triticina]